jgi:hypothetical protein
MTTPLVRLLWQTARILWQTEFCDKLTIVTNWILWQTEFSVVSRMRRMVTNIGHSHVSRLILSYPKRSPPQSLIGNKLDNASIVRKSGSFSRFLPWLRFWPGQFYNHKDRSIQEEFWGKNLEYYGFILTPRNGIYNFEGVKSLKLCLKHELVLLHSYKINSKYAGITVTGRIFSGDLKKWSSYIVNKSVQRIVLKYLEATFIFIWIKERF